MNTQLTREAIDHINHQLTLQLQQVYVEKLLELDTCCPDLSLSTRTYIGRLVFDDIYGRMKQELEDQLEDNE